MNRSRFIPDFTRSGGVEAAPLLEKELSLEPDTIVIDVPDDLDKEPRAEPVGLLRGLMNRFLPEAGEKDCPVSPPISSARIDPFQVTAINGDSVDVQVNVHNEPSETLVSRDWGLPANAVASSPVVGSGVVGSGVVGGGDDNASERRVAPGAICRVCFGPDTSDQPLFAPCACPEAVRHVHRVCFNQWRLAGLAEMAMRCPHCLALYCTSEGVGWRTRVGRALKGVLDHRAIVHTVIWILLALITVGVRSLDSGNALIRGLHLQCDYWGFFTAFHRVCAREVTDDAFIALYYVVIVVICLVLLCLSWCYRVFSLPNRRHYFRQCRWGDVVVASLLWIMATLFTLFTNLFFGVIVLTITVEALLRVQLEYFSRLLEIRLYMVLPYTKAVGAH